ncbi:uncharacterized protein LOC129737549 [Uranotaenia lowii]|uniref:uncharacterized protein LOC129737549 n=1 Tax=Uranotaenia lowii TaxID=190385 RepID=UPI00247A1637|nr:uncharacterized protein LOC129737549 [Uranotaenia lowii]
MAMGSSKSNPADEATKWGSGPYFNSESIWFNGPEFLSFSESRWPQPTEPVTPTSEEIRNSILHHRVVEPVLDFNRFATWGRLNRVTAYVLRYLQNRFKGAKLTGPLQQEELKMATEVILRHVQEDSFAEETSALKNTVHNKSGRRAIEKRSTIYQLMPFIDEKGLLRERGRIDAVKNVPYDTRHPIILPKNHPVTDLLILDYHEVYRHRNSETVVNELRQLYSIPKLRALVKKVSKNCQICRIRLARPRIPVMAPLPPARLAHHERAFTYTGLDYFGPLLVKLGRARVKRWIALFTCLTVRAVHLEVAYTLSTESCISCVRRFVGRRGSPIEFFTDNGTNFQGADRVLRGQISQGLSATFTNANTKWSFNPPGAPHMGGAWERLVQSVKIAMADAYTEGKLDDEGLQTLVVESESMINKRPLTYLPLESDEAEALTPNHFLLLSSNGNKSPRQNHQNSSAVSHESYRNILGNSWSEIQTKLNVFWHRWLVEYLPVIRRQPKWFDETKPIEAGDLVMVAETAKSGKWERGRILEVLRNPDGRSRRAVVQIGANRFIRPVSRMAVLDVVNREAADKSNLHQGEGVISSQLATRSATIDKCQNRESCPT